MGDPHIDPSPSTGMASHQRWLVISILAMYDPA